MTKILPPKWTPAGTVARFRAIIRRPRDVVLALRMGAFLGRAFLALARENRMEQLARPRRKARLPLRFERDELTRIVRISYIYHLLCKSRMSPYVRALMVNHFMDSEAFDGMIFGALEQMVAYGRRGGHCAVLLFDIDQLGSLSDLLGDDAGYRVLDTIGKVVNRQISGTGIAGRFGGDEFLVLLRDASGEGAMHVADEIRAAVEAAGLERGDGTRVTVSAGVALASYAADAADMVERADRALHRAKERGRNCVVASPVDSM